MLRRIIAVQVYARELTLVVIVQISDMHVSVPGKLFFGQIDTRASFERAIARVLSLDPKPDIVLLTGDLAETGVGAEYEFIAGQIKRLYCPVVAIPGNHDVRAEMLRLLPDCVSEHGGFLNIVNDDFPVRIVGLDTIIPGEVNGEICEKRLSWLREVLSRASSKPTLIAMHHPPFTTGLRAMDNYGIKRGREEFAAIVAEHAKKICGVVCGHAHRSIVANIAGVPVLLSPAASVPFELHLGEIPSLKFVREPQQFMVHTWSKETGLVSHAAFIDEFPGPFSLR